ncbi:hypothetical protein HPB47_011325 [Ixodes persulcatus]|uniref:Uncharacterized protein n=1 Tax=Ixodes persulcatus TaxID=34615 RepID=A0AC60NWK2_IXOPE|nr:hypothetical protein HPB47_011325 [Ixodes persulcatus]
MFEMLVEQPATAMPEKTQQTVPRIGNVDGRTFVEVPGERISPGETEGWKVSGKRIKEIVNGTSGGESDETQRQSRPRTRVNYVNKITSAITKGARMPVSMPKEDIKIVVRPRGGLNVAKMGGPAAMAAITRAAKVEEDPEIEVGPRTDRAAEPARRGGPSKALENGRLDRHGERLDKVYKIALGLPGNVSTQRLLELGVHNTLEEIAEAQRTAHLERLSSTRTGRKILQDLGVNPSGVASGDTVPIPSQMMTRLQVYPIPRNMNPIHDTGRRAARARAIVNSYAQDERAVYVDAAEYQDRGEAYTAVVVSASNGATRAAASTRVRNSHQAKEVAIALAVANPGCNTVISDSRTAVLSFAKGRVCGAAARILRAATTTGRDRDGAVVIKWIPAHMGSEVSVNGLYADDTCGLRKKARATASHLLWDCELNPREASEKTTIPPQFEDAARSSELEVQRRAVRLITTALDRQRARDDGGDEGARGGPMGSPSRPRIEKGRARGRGLGGGE